MRELAVALRWEFFKAARLRLPKALLAVWLGVLVLHAWLTYRAYQDVVRYAGQVVRESPSPLRQQRAMQQELLARLLRANLVMPTSYAGVSNVLYFPGLVFVSSASAWLVGTEFTWGTLQRQLARGRRRPVVVAAKLGLVAALAAAWVAAGLLTGSLTGFCTSRLLGAWSPGVLSGQVLRDLLVVAGRVWAVLATYGAAAVAFAFLLRSAGLATAAVLIFYLVDVLVASLIVQSHGWLTGLRPYLLSNVGRALVVEHNPFGPGLAASARAAMAELPRLLPVGTAWLVLGAWASFFALVSFAGFVRRDLPA